MEIKNVAVIEVIALMYITSITDEKSGNPVKYEVTEYRSKDGRLLATVSKQVYN